MTTYGITDAGFVVKPYEIMKGEIEDEQKAVWGDAIDQTATSVLGQMNGIFGFKLGELWELAQALYSSNDPDAANTTSLENVAALCPGIERNPATKSTVTVNCNLDNGTYAIGSLIANVTGDATARFANVSAITQAAGPGLVSNLGFEAETAGAIAAALGTLTEISEPVVGWNAISNTSAATVGDEVETDTEFRLRRRNTIALPGGSSVMGVRADVLDLDEVDICDVRENDTDLTDGNGLPPHSFHTVYKKESSYSDAVADVAVGQAIHDSKPGGIATYGSLDEDYTDSGSTITINFDRFTEVPVYIDLTIPNYTTVLTAQQQADIETAVIAAVEDTDIDANGNRVLTTATISAAAMDLISTYDDVLLLLVELDTHDSPDANQSLTAGFGELFVTDAAKVDLKAS